MELAALQYGFAPALASALLHSLWQATVNRVMVRFALFLLSSLALIALIVHAAIAVFD